MALASTIHSPPSNLRARCADVPVRAPGALHGLDISTLSSGSTGTAWMVSSTRSRRRPRGGISEAGGCRGRCFRHVLRQSVQIAVPYAVTHDGKRFLFPVPAQRQTTIPLTVVVNWLSPPQR